MDCTQLLTATFPNGAWFMRKLIRIIKWRFLWRVPMSPGFKGCSIIVNVLISHHILGNKYLNYLKNTQHILVVCPTIKRRLFCSAAEAKNLLPIIVNWMLASSCAWRHTETGEHVNYSEIATKTLKTIYVFRSIFCMLFGQNKMYNIEFNR